VRDAVAELKHHLEVPDVNLIPRRAKIEHRCVCADAVLRWHVVRPSGGSSSFWSEESARQGLARAPEGSVLETVANPNFQAGCVGDIARGHRYVEYVGEAPAYRSGTPYCVPCAVLVWGVVDHRRTRPGRP
jgi:hypothetical protein